MLRRPTTGVTCPTCQQASGVGFRRMEGEDDWEKFLMGWCFLCHHPVDEADARLAPSVEDVLWAADETEVQ